jgi:hypothetical protein
MEKEPPYIKEARKLTTGINAGSSLLNLSKWAIIDAGGLLRNAY